MTPKAPKETAEQKQQRMIAQRENRDAMMDAAGDRTRAFSRYMRPRISIVTAKSMPTTRPL